MAYDEVFGLFHPVLAEWFHKKYGQPTDVQKRAWQAIRAGSHTLIAAPTGSGKTLAAVLPCLDRIAKAKQADPDAEAGVRVLYITPLKALNNDIDHHLAHFLKEMESIAAYSNLPSIRVGVRTGDTPPKVRAAMLKQPPDLLVTTPESFYLLMTSEKGRNMLKTVRQVVVDEIHNLAADKRGAHLSLTLERLVEWSGVSPQRIGVSATQKPMERVARFLGGWEGEQPRPVEIIESRIEKKMDVRVTMPEQRTPAADQDGVWNPLVEKVLQWMEGCTTALVFVNSRRLCERLTLRLNDFVGYEMARSHHGSISREKRLEVERMLKSGELRCLVATSSLELGIDVGHVDLVIQIDSPREAAAGIQRIGRAGHSVGGVSRGVIIARSRGDLPEAAVLCKLISARDIEEIRIPRHCLDVLSQQTVAMVAVEDWDVGRLHDVISRSDSYRGFPRERLEAMLQVLSGYYPFARPLIEWDRDSGQLRRRRNTAMAALIGAGTIPQSSGYPVYHQESRIHLGELEEEFVFESRVGDVFQLGTSSWMIREITGDRVYVTECDNNYSEIPFWVADAGGRSFELGMKVGAFLRELNRRLDDEIADGLPGAERRTFADDTVYGWLTSVYRLDTASADSLISFIRGQRAVSPVPTDRTIVVEHFTDEVRQKHIVIHSVFGRKFNRTWQLALQRYFEKHLPCSFYCCAKDNGIEFVFREWDDAWLSMIWRVNAKSLEPLLLEAIPAMPLFAVTFRRIAETSLLLARGFSRTPAWKKRLQSEELLKEGLPYAGQFPYLREAMDVCMNELLDVQHVAQVLNDIEHGRIHVAEKQSRFPSPFAAQFLADFVGQKMYESDALNQDLQRELLGVSKTLAAEWFGKEALRNAIAPEVLERERKRLEGGSPDAAGDAEDIYRLLKERGDMTMDELRKFAGTGAEERMSELARAGRIERIILGGEERWICRDERETYASFAHDPASASFVLNRFIDTRLSFTADDLRARYPLSAEQAQAMIADWTERSVIEPAPFADAGEEGLWTSSKVASRLLRFSLRHYRSLAEPVEPERFCAHLLALHHMTGTSRLSGSEGVRRVIEGLQGVFLPVSLWESVVFPARVHGYRKEDLDLLCASGEIVWVGKKSAEDKEGSVAFFLAESKELYSPLFGKRKETKHPELLRIMREKGASFLSSLSRETGLLPSELLEQMLDLVWEGRISNDQFEPVRLHAKGGPNKAAKFQSGLGRWYVLDTLADPAIPPEKSAVSWAHQLLRSHGIVTKHAVTDDVPFSWDTMLGVLKRLEEWGAVTRGLFVRNVRAVQFSAKETAQQLRQPVITDDPDRLVALCALDPANPYGQLFDWPDRKGVQFARKPGNYLIISGGRWVLWIENYGRRIHVMEDGEQADYAAWLKTVFQTFVSRHGLRKIVIETWNGEKVVHTPACARLIELGAERDRASLVFWPSSIR